MATMYGLAPAPSVSSPLLNPHHTAALYDVVIEEDLYAWHVCPIDNMPNNACFHLPGVTNGPTAPAPAP